MADTTGGPTNITIGKTSTSGSSTQSMGTGWVSTKGGFAGAEDPLAKFASAQDPILRASLFSEVYAKLAATPSGQGSQNMFDYIQSLLRAKGYSKGTTALGIVDNEDMNGLSKALQGAVAMNVPNAQGQYRPILGMLTSYLQSQSATGGTTTQYPSPSYTKLISTSLQYKDAGDAANALSNAYFLAFGVFPNESNLTSFKDAWNKESKLQAATTTTTSAAIPTPKKDAKGKIMYDKNGKVIYETTTKTGTVTTGEGFTADEQAQFLANYIVQNAPGEKWDLNTLGGQAKTLYDELNATYKNNFLTAPSLPELMPTILNALKTNDANVTKEIMDQAKRNIRVTASKNWAGIGQDMLDGNADAATFLNPLMSNLSKTLGVTIDENDPLVKKMINFKDKNGNARVANAEEQNSLLFEDGRIWNTDTYRTVGMNLGQALKSQLGR